MHIITYFSYSKHSSPLFKSLNIIKLSDLDTFYIAKCVHKCHSHLLPSVFDLFVSRLTKYIINV